MELQIVELVPEADMLPLRAARAIREADAVVLQSERAECAKQVREWNRNIVTLDDLFETAEDFDALYAALADSDIMRHYPYTFDEARVRGWISKNIERYDVFGFGLWAVCLKATGEMIGNCGLTMQCIDGTIVPEIGYHIAKAHQYRGFAREAAIAVRDWTFTHTPFGAV